eukprot:TRINITY_DN170_c0_g2_i1.p1 TRINITY_DN170_c0_g2~~TRINITY_DN170_c0_g2_i1.p1  ORF type:complete len:423 (-),score=88.88 TRINITY_DN170_c0_g2_i1:19-1287(-)
MKKLSHPNIVKLYEVIDDPSHERLFLVLQYVEGGAIMDKSMSNPVDEGTARRYMHDILHGLLYLHKQKIIHRDIKPENLLVDEDGVVKITDFGVSHIFDDDDDTLLRTAGSPAFLAPELTTTSGPAARGREVDCYALGVTLYCLVYGTVPFMAENILTIYEKIRNDPVDFPRGTNPKSSLNTLILGLMEKNPTKRLTLDQALKHPWMCNKGEYEVEADPADSVVVKVTDEDVDRAVENRFVMLIRLKTRMKALSTRARKRLVARNGEDGDASIGNDFPGTSTTPTPTPDNNNDHLGNGIVGSSGDADPRETGAEMRLYQFNNLDSCSTHSMDVTEMDSTWTGSTSSSSGLPLSARRGDNPRPAGLDCPTDCTMTATDFPDEASTSHDSLPSPPVPRKSLTRSGQRKRDEHSSSSRRRREFTP